MSTFADIPENTGESKFKSTEYVKIQAGFALRLRVLDKRATHQVRHYIPTSKISILCLGDEECPICKKNSALMRENPKAAPREIKGFIARQNRFLVNVLNRTMAKVTLSGKVVYPIGGQFPGVDTETGEDLSRIEPKPLNRIEVLDKGPELYQQLNMANDQVTDATGNPIGLWNFNIGITATGVGRKMKTAIVSYPNENDKVEVKEEDKYVLSTLGIQLTPSEIEKVLTGVSLRDIFAARRADDGGVEVEAVAVSADVQSKINTLFGA